MLKLIHYIFLTYTTMMAVRIIASWFPSTRGQAWLYWISRCVDPYLNLFRRFIPPIGGTLDLSPMLGFFALQFLESMVSKLLSRC